jgi:hypothetical protein
MAEEAKKNKYTYHLLNIEDKCLVLRIDFNVSFAKACEIIAMFGSERKTFAEKLVKDLNKGAITE